MKTIKHLTIVIPFAYELDYSQEHFLRYSVSIMYQINNKPVIFIENKILVADNYNSMVSQVKSEVLSYLDLNESNIKQITFITNKLLEIK